MEQMLDEHPKEDKEEWITAAGALVLLKPTMGPDSAAMAICKRAHDGLIRTRAERLVRDSEGFENTEVPQKFWWADGHTALEQNWKTGDFSTWIDRRFHWKAYSVSFLRSDIEKMIPNLSKQETASAPSNATGGALGGRPKADWSEDLWIEICRQLYVGDLQPKKQADIESAMSQWLSARDEHPSVSTIRSRARKLWQAIKSEGEN